jgi:hypothetical protein
METEATEANPSLKREREEADDSAAAAAATEAAEEAPAKKAKVEEDAKEAEDAAVKGEEDEGAKAEEGKPVKLGPKEFASAVDMFDYFFALLHSWSTQLDFNKVRPSGGYLASR